MKRNLLLLLSLATVVVCGALPAAADLYTVTLDNGAVFETRYQPIEDPSGAAKLMLLTDQSNWISLPMEIVASVTTEFESRGFGLRIDSITVDLGFLPNDAADPAQAEPADPASALLRALERPEEPYTVRQFVEPEEAGGIPVGWTRRTTPPIGGGG